MRILVTGAGGFLGRHLTHNLAKNGHYVRAMVRKSGGQLESSPSIEVVHSDLRRPSTYQDVFETMDAVIHAAAAVSGNEDQQFNSTVVGTETFLEQLARSNIRRLVHVSSLVVYDWNSAKKELTEDTEEVRFVYDRGAYTIAKFWQERLIREFSDSHSVKLTIVRPGFVWGPGRSNLAGMGRAVGPFHLVFGPLGHLPLTHVENCADLLRVAVERTPAATEVFNVTDGHQITSWNYARRYYRNTGSRKWLVPVPYAIGLGAAVLARKLSDLFFGPSGRLPSVLDPAKYAAQFKPLRYPTGKVRQDLGWRAPLPFDRCVELTFGTEATRG